MGDDMTTTYRFVATFTSEIAGTVEAETAEEARKKIRALDADTLKMRIHAECGAMVSIRSMIIHEVLDDLMWHDCMGLELVSSKKEDPPA